MKYLIYLFICSLLLASSCQKKPEYPVEPSIKMKYLTKDMVEETIPTMVNNEWVEPEDSIKIVSAKPCQHMYETCCISSGRKYHQY